MKKTTKISGSTKNINEDNSGIYSQEMSEPWAAALFWDEFMKLYMKNVPNLFMT